MDAEWDVVKNADRSLCNSITGNPAVIVARHVRPVTLRPRLLTGLLFQFSSLNFYINNQTLLTYS